MSGGYRKFSTSDASETTSVQLPGVNVCAGLSLSSIPLYIRCVVLVSRGSPGSVGAIRIGPSSFPAGNVIGKFRCVLVEQASNEG